MSKTTIPTIATLAAEAYAWFETATRSDGESFTRTKDGAPEWIRELVRSAHGDMLPDGWRYDCIHAALNAIEDNGYEDERVARDGAHEFADNYVDVYNRALLDWFQSNLTRPYYCDDAVRELGAPDGPDIYQTIRMGQYMEALEVYGFVLDALNDRMEEV